MKFYFHGITAEKFVLFSPSAICADFAFLRDFPQLLELSGFVWVQIKGTEPRFTAVCLELKSSHFQAFRVSLLLFYSLSRRIHHFQTIVSALKKLW